MTGPPPLRMVLTLLAGRAAFRGMVVLSAPLLLAAWGADVFGPYALAMGSTLVLNPLVGSGTEKSAGTLVPRYRPPAADRVLGAHLVVAAAITGCSLLLAVPFALADPDRAELWLLAGATNVGFGAVQALVAYWRVLGQPSADPASFGVLAIVTAGGLALAGFAGLGPQTYLALQAGTAAAVCAVLVLRLRGHIRLRRLRRRALRLVARTTVLMGTNTLLATAPFSVVVAVLGGQWDPATVSHFYVALTVYTIAGNVLDYLQRVYQPWLTTALRATPERVLEPTRRGARLGRAVLAPVGALAVVTAGWTLGPVLAPLAGMVAVTPTLMMVALVLWVRENAVTATLGATTRAGIIGLAGTAAVALLLVPPLAATGALLALLLGAAVQLPLLATALPADRVRARRPARATRLPAGGGWPR